MEKQRRKIEFIDGVRFAKAILAGAKWLMEREKQLNDINVFPVPDGDTGTNMGGTLKALADNAEYMKISSISEASKAVAETALMAARGNSGAILAQFFQGLSEGLEKYRKVTTVDFAQAAKIASDKSVEAVSKPKEGTILTVIRDWSEYLVNQSSQMLDFADLFYHSLEVARVSLKKTKEQMEVLKKANVVDAGAQGFVYILEGVMNFAEQGRMNREKWFNTSETSAESHADHTSIESSEYRYCTECMVIGMQIDQKRVKEVLAEVGNSTVVVGSPTKIRVHIHTNMPGKVFEELRNFGAIQQEKIDDIFQQEKDIYGDVNHSIALVTDTCSDIPEELVAKYNIHRIPFKINMGEITHIDEATITDEEFYQQMESSTVVPKTSQLLQPDLKRMMDWTNKYFDSTLCLIMARSLSASVDTAKRVAKTISDKIIVIDTNTICVGLGLITLVAAKAIEKGKTLDQTIKLVQTAMEHQKQVFTVRDLKYLIRGGRLSTSKGFIANLLHLKPLLHTEKDGSLHPLSNAFGQNGLKKKLLSTMKKTMIPGKKYWIAIGHCNNEETALWYKKQIESLFSPTELYVTSIASTIGSHSGPGTISIAYFPEPEF
ncbi:DegV family EDD domain-containing protein [bacterium]|nr:DegV family EDD domain-containing protein [bacterium]